MAEKMLWNREKSACCKASKIREITIMPTRYLGTDGPMYEIKGWYNSSEGFWFGAYKTEGAARRFVNKLNAAIEGVKNEQKPGA